MGLRVAAAEEITTACEHIEAILALVSEEQYPSGRDAIARAQAYIRARGY